MHDEVIRQLALAFAEAGKEFYLVGGTVRDTLLGRVSHDIDAATDAFPAEIRSIAATTAPLHIVTIGEKFGTIQIHYEHGIIVEVTTYRGERYIAGSRKPEVQFSLHLLDDLRRRDFTINAIAQNPLTGEIIDPHHGQDDLVKRLIRAVEDPNQRFTDDPLRMLRAIRFEGQLEFTLTYRTAQAIAEEAHRLATISAERVRDELCKMLLVPFPDKCIRRLIGRSLMSDIMPEVETLLGVTQMPHHLLDAYEHTLLVLNDVPARLPVRLAALLHDIGKPATRTIDGEVTHFYGHEEVGAKLARTLLRRLRFENALIEQVVTMIALHMRVNSYTPRWSDGAVRRLVLDAGSVLDDLLDLALADGISDKDAPVEDVLLRLNDLRTRCHQVQGEQRDRPFISPLSGDELIALFDRAPGPWIKEVKKHLGELVIEGALLPGDKERATEVALSAFPQYR